MGNPSCRSVAVPSGVGRRIELSMWIAAGRGNSRMAHAKVLWCACVLTNKSA